MIMEGFYKFDGENWYYAPNFVYAKDYILEKDENGALNILKEGLKIRSSASYAVNQNEATVKPKVCKDEVGSCVATKQKTKVFVSFG